ncbi:hypothetical protein [Deinococcus sp.]|uniref:hypothetical protein n=1 Tax=Deinococcus sp. TaxID=47478 RepID=UPI003CC55D5E
MAWTILVAVCCAAQAHPVDELLQGAYLTLAPGAVQLELDLTPGTQVAGGWLRTIDANADGQISASEARTFARQVLAQSRVTVGGVDTPWALDQVVTPPYQNLLTGNDVLKIYAVARRPDRAGAGTFTYQNRYQPVKSRWMANVFLLPAAGWQYGVSGQQHSTDGQTLTVTYTAVHH